MNKHTLQHILVPFSAADSIESLTVDARWQADELQLVYRLWGQLELLVWPSTAEGTRRMGLWETTCMESFLRHPDEDRYVEVNATPNGDWQCLALSGYRAPATPSHWPRIIDICSRRPASHCRELTVNLDTRDAPFARTDTLQLGLSAVIAMGNAPAAETRHYFALSHVDGAPDFHHRDTHTLQLIRINQ